MEKVPAGPKRILRETLDYIRAGAVPFGDLEVPDSLKPEIYALAAHFIEKSAADAKKWLIENPDRLLWREVVERDGRRVVTHVNESSETEVMDVTNPKEIFERISQAIGGLLEFHVLENMNSDEDADDYGEGQPSLDERESTIQARLDVLLASTRFRQGGQAGSEGFVLSATAAPATFIPTIYYAGLAHYYENFKRFPRENELDNLLKQLDVIILKMASVNIVDIAKLLNEHEILVNDEVVVDSLINLLVAEKKGDEIKVDMPQLETMRNPEGLRVEDTLGCPAMYAKAEGQNVVRFLCSYAAHLVKKSGIYVEGSKE